jgi:hypothetical protein
MHLRKITFALFSLLLLPRTSSAKALEITLNALTTTGTVMGSAVRADTAGGFAFNTGLDLSYPLNDKWQITAPIVAAYSGGLTLSAYLGPQYNFGSEDLMNAYFVNAKIGGEIAAGSFSILLGAGGGKRWKLTESVTYHPSLNVFSNVSAKTGVFFAAVPLAFSVILDVL